jgi:hypothetical protein
MSDVPDVAPVLFASCLAIGQSARATEVVDVRKANEAMATVRARMPDSLDELSVWARDSYTRWVRRTSLNGQRLGGIEEDHLLGREPFMLTAMLER